MTTKTRVLSASAVGGMIIATVAIAIGAGLAICTETLKPGWATLYGNFSTMLVTLVGVLMLMKIQQRGQAQEGETA